MAFDFSNEDINTPEGLNENLKLYTTLIKEKRQDLELALVPAADAFLYLLKLSQEQLLTEIGENEFDDLYEFSQLLIEHADSFLTAYPITAETKKHFESLLADIYAELPAGLEAIFQQELQQLETALNDDMSPKPAARTNQDILTEEPLENTAAQTTEGLTKAQKKSITPAILKAIAQKISLKPAQLAKVLAACAVLSVPSSDKQWPTGPEVMFTVPEAFSQGIQAQVAEVVQAARPVFENFERAPALPALESPSPDTPFRLLQQAPYPTEVVAEEIEAMERRLQFVLNTPERRTLFETLRQNPNHRDVVALIGVIESNLDVNAVSHSGAMGMMQDMGGLQGAFGDPDTVEHLAVNDLLPAIDHPEYNQIISNLRNNVQMDRGTLLDFLITQRNASTPFWETFEQAQARLLINPETSAAIAHQYLQDLQDKALDRLPINSDPLEALNFAVMSYNLGMGHLHTLRRIMALNGVTDFNTFNVLSFMDRDDFVQILRANNLGELQNNYAEAKHYLARFITLQATVMQNNTRTLDSTTG